MDVRWRRVVLVLGATTLVLLVAVAVTGTALARDYTPAPPGADPAVEGGLVGHVADLTGQHRWAAAALAVSATLLALTAIAGAVVTRPRRPFRIVAAIVFAGFVALAAQSGYAVAWDQLAVFAVTTGAHVNGVWFAAFSDEVRFVFVDDTELSQGRYARDVVLHLFVFPVLVLATGALAAVQRRRPPAPPDA